MALNVWDLIPVFGVYLTAPGDLPTGGTVTFKLSQRVTRTDGRVIYPGGAEVKVQIGNPDSQNATVRAAVRSAWRAADQAAEGAGFDGAAWDIWWDTVVLPAAVFTGFPASDDPDITQRGWTVSVTEALTAGQGKQYAIQPLLAHLANPIPGINLGTVEVPPGSPTVPAPVYAKGVAGGVAALDADGDVVDASGVKVTGGGDVASVNGLTGAVTLSAADVGALPTSYTPPAPAWGDVTGKPATFAPAAHTQAISTVTGLQTALDGKATAAQGAKADTAVQPAGLTKAAVGLGNVDNTSDANKPISTAAQAALDEKKAASWTPGLADLPGTLAGIVRHNGTAWPARPTARTDVTYIWFDPTGTHGTPSGAVTNVDLLLSPQA